MSAGRQGDARMGGGRIGGGRPVNSSGSLVSLGLAGFALAGSYLAIRSGLAAPVDAAVRTRVANARKQAPPAVDGVVAVATDIGSIYSVAGAATALVASGHRSLGVEVAAAGGLAWTATQAVKPLLHRSRPYEMGEAERLVAIPAGSSWPSGHAAVAMAMATTVGARFTKKGRLPIQMSAIVVGLSRLYVGVHHLTDVVAGLGVGVLTARMARRAARYVLRE